MATKSKYARAICVSLLTFTIDNYIPNDRFTVIYALYTIYKEVAPGRLLLNDILVETTRSRDLFRAARRVLKKNTCRSDR